MSVTVKLSTDYSSMRPETRVFTEDGVEIEDVCAIDISIRTDSYRTAKLEVMIANDTTIEGLLPVLGFDSLEALAASQGYYLVKGGQQENCTPLAQPKSK